MLDLATIDQLAAQAFRLEPLPDAYAEYRQRWAYDPQNINQPMWWGKPQPYYKFLYYMAKRFSGGMALEIGTHAGIGFACLAAGAAANGHPKSWTVGVDKDNHGAAQEVPTKYLNCRFINGISTQVVEQITALCTDHQITIKIMFIDATHTLNWVNAEINTYKHLFANQVVIIMDDCIHADNNTKLPECFERLPGQKVLYPNLHTDNCIGVALALRADFDAWKPPLLTEVLTV